MSFRDDFFDRQSELIDEYGWAVVHVVPSEDDPDEAVPFAYTVGLTGFGLSELAIAGLPPEVGHSILNELAVRVRDEGLQLRHGERLTDLIVDQDVVIVAGDPTADVFPGAALARYGDDRVHLHQVVWPDPWDTFPWQEGYESVLYPQPTIAAPGRPAQRRHTFRGIPHSHGRRRGARARRRSA
ncbi:DUF4262 domain-containing protein [Actinoplanes sp. NPDC051861]|uniref:DUF4262 domain-containing protein n=1 Tax=Actinoplanes sp. NPDC051861 TaxID=3155170 RepID=UPI003441890C